MVDPSRLFTNYLEATHGKRQQVDGFTAVMREFVKVTPIPDRVRVML